MAVAGVSCRTLEVLFSRPRGALRKSGGGTLESRLPPMLAAGAEGAFGSGGSDLNPLAAAAAREIRAALERNKGHRANTARELGISPSTLWRKMKRLGIAG